MIYDWRQLAEAGHRANARRVNYGRIFVDDVQVRSVFYADTDRGVVISYDIGIDGSRYLVDAERLAVKVHKGVVRVEEAESQGNTLMTVADVIERLQLYPPEAIVVALYDAHYYPLDGFQRLDGESEAQAWADIGPSSFGNVAVPVLLVR